MRFARRLMSGAVMDPPSLLFHKDILLLYKLLVNFDIIESRYFVIVYTETG